LKLIDYSEESKETRREDGESRKICYIVMELLPGGEVFDLIYETGELEENLARRFFREMLMGVQHMHARGKAHRDLKLENMMFGENNKVVIIDFGFVTDTKGVGQLQGTGYHKKRCGTPGYMAPELLKGDIYKGTDVDLFALAVILFIMVTGSPPF